MSFTRRMYVIWDGAEEKVGKKTNALDSQRFDVFTICFLGIVPVI